MKPVDKKRRNSLIKAAPFALALVAALLILFFVRGESEGKRLYTQHCANCHMDDGSGLQGLIPPLAGADYLQLQSDMLACNIRYGLQGEIEVNGRMYNEPMPGNEDLTYADITNIINYIRNSWGNEHAYMGQAEVKAQLNDCTTKNDTL